jgi:hypothetical protein
MAARGDDEAALNSMWSIMQTQFERGRTPECPGPTRDDARKMLAGLHRVAARPPQGEDPETARPEQPPPDRLGGQPPAEPPEAP